MVIVPQQILGLSASTLERFVLKARRAARLPGTVNVLVTESKHLRALNRQFRKKDKATDVLSFLAPPELQRRSKAFAGDLAISADIARENAVRLGHSLAEEVKILTLHGILHLAGFDHEQDHGEMARRESRLRRLLNLEDGLIERSNHAENGRRNSNHRKPRSSARRRTA